MLTVPWMPVKRAAVRANHDEIVALARAVHVDGNARRDLGDAHVVVTAARVDVDVLDLARIERRGLVVHRGGCIGAKGVDSDIVSVVDGELVSLDAQVEVTLKAAAGPVRVEEKGLRVAVGHDERSVPVGPIGLHEIAAQAVGVPGTIRFVVANLLCPPSRWPASRTAA